MESTPPTDVNAAIAANSPESTTVQDSSIFSYICDLSPIKPVNAASVEQGFRGLNSPPLVFQSPQINTQTSLDLKRTQCPLSLSQHGDGDKGKNNPTGADECGKSDSQLSCQLNPQTYKVRRSNSSRRDQTHSSTGSLEEYLDDFLADYKYSTHSANSESRLSDDVSRLLDGSTNSTDVNIANKEDEQDLATAVQASPAKFEQAKEENQGSSTSHLKPVENDDLQHSEHVNESFQWYNEYGQTTGVVVPDRPVVNNKTYIPKATQSEVRKRKRLQFEEAYQNFIGDGSCFWNRSNSPSFSYASPGYSDDPDSSCVNFPATPSNMQLGNMSQSKDRNLMSTVSKPSGIGLHLNSIVNALPLSSTAKIKVADGSCLTVGGSASSASCPSPYISKPSLKIVEHRATSDISGKANSEHSGIIEASYQASNKKKRKKTSETSDGDGCKRCNCKKTQCLKLYCDCFAAGIYCDDPCACQGCFNRPEYDDTVIETRQQIESRNPLAFAPKIIQRLTQVPAIRSREDGRRSAPLSGRHKKGCNCKKSTCLKKYCECYQANVGCSDACRCEGCKNIYGRKGEYKITRDDSIETINDKSGSSSEQKSELESTTDNYLFPEFQTPQSSTPATPLFQCSDHGTDASKSQLYSAIYLPSPESCTTLLPPHVNVPGSPNNTAPHEKIQETRKDVLDHEPDYGNVEIVGESLPKRRKLGNICHLNSLPTYSASDTPISFESSKTRDLVNNSGLQNSRPQFGSGSGQHWRGLPLTPETRLCDILEDETPQILKENQTMCNTIKVRSPNKKRVSPPISCSSTSSLTPLKSGHMILKAIPSFPSLNPCMGSKNMTKMKDPQNARNNE